MSSNTPMLAQSSTQMPEMGQFLTGSLSHFILHDNRTMDAGTMSEAGYLRPIVQGIQSIATLVILGESEAPLEEGGLGNGRIRFTIENSGRTAEDLEQAIHESSEIPRQVDADLMANPPIMQVEGIRVTQFTY